MGGFLRLGVGHPYQRNCSFPEVCITLPAELPIPPPWPPRVPLGPETPQALPLGSLWTWGCFVSERRRLLREEGSRKQVSFPARLRRRGQCHHVDMRGQLISSLLPAPLQDSLCLSVSLQHPVRVKMQRAERRTGRFQVGSMFAGGADA